MISYGGHSFVNTMCCVSPDAIDRNVHCVIFFLLVQVNVIYCCSLNGFVSWYSLSVWLRCKWENREVPLSYYHLFPVIANGTIPVKIKIS